MKHSCNDDSGIKMDSNEHDSMELNELLVETNNLTYYTHKTEQRMQSYDMTNSAPEYANFGDLAVFEKETEMSARY